MSQESSNLFENSNANNTQDVESLETTQYQNQDSDQQAINQFLEQAKQTNKKELLPNKELFKIISIRKRNQTKSKIEINISPKTGPISSYTIFLKHMHQLLIDTNKNISFSQRSILIANLWSMMSEKDKEPLKYSANQTNQKGELLLDS